MNLLMFNLATDSEHVALAFGLGWIEALAKHFDRIDVVTMFEGKHALPPNVYVHSAGRELGLPMWKRILRFYVATIRIIREHKPAIAFSHMIPEFSILFWPLAKIARIPSVLWYAHGHIPCHLYIAEMLVDHIVSSTPEGFRLPSKKVTFIGQGIDAGLYTYRPHIKGDTLNIVSVGRLAPSKGQDKIIAGLAEWNKSTSMPWHLTLVGAATNDEEKHFADQLRAQADTLFPKNQITFTGRLNADKILPIVAQADVSLSLGTTGSLDKTIVEAMACGCPVLSCNDAFRAIAQAEGFSECVVEDTPRSVSEGLSRFASLSDERRQQLGQKQSKVALRDHTLDGLIGRLLVLLLSFVPPNTKEGP